MTYPIIWAADTTRWSMARLPLEIILMILRQLFEVSQIIHIDIFGPPPISDDDRDPLPRHGSIARNTVVVLHEPPLNKASHVCRLFRFLYEQIRPHVWGAHLFPGQNYYVNLLKDIFYVQVHRKVHSLEWFHDGQPHLDPLYGMLKDCVNMATSPASVDIVNNTAGTLYLRHLNPQVKKIMLFVPSKNIGKNHTLNGGLITDAAVRPMHDDFVVGPYPHFTWDFYKLSMWEVVDSWQVNVVMFGVTSEQIEALQENWLYPIPEYEGYVVEEEALASDP